MQEASFEPADAVPAEAIWRASVRDYPTDPRATEAVETLISSVEELLCRFPAARDSEMGRVRSRTINALTVAKAVVAENFPIEGPAGRPPARSELEAWIVARPRAALAVAGALGLVIGFCSSWWVSRHRRGR